jgi:cytochrome c biogenesis factor
MTLSQGVIDGDPDPIAVRLYIDPLVAGVFGGGFVASAAGLLAAWIYRWAA